MTLQEVHLDEQGETAGQPTTEGQRKFTTAGRLMSTLPPPQKSCHEVLSEAVNNSCNLRPETPFWFTGAQCA